MRNMLISKKKFTVLLLILAMVFILAGCGNTDGTPVYKVDVAELDPSVYPDDYPLIDSSDFESAVENLKQANIDGELDTYQDIVNIFGVDGAYYENCDREDEGITYKYYGWYSYNDVGVIITFKAKGSKLKYYAYTTSGTN